MIVDIWDIFPVKTVNLSSSYNCIWFIYNMLGSCGLRTFVNTSEVSFVIYFNFPQDGAFSHIT